MGPGENFGLCLTAKNLQETGYRVKRWTVCTGLSTGDHHHPLHTRHLAILSLQVSWMGGERGGGGVGERREWDRKREERGKDWERGEN